MALKKLTYYNPADLHSLSQFQNDFLDHLNRKRKKNQPLVLLCIGTDRATGDCLGPFVGQAMINSPIYSIYGTLQHPVHAKNLENTLHKISISHENPFIIAVDSCLGCKEHVGHITLSSMPLFPGQGVFKEIAPVGDLSITGIVDIFSSSSHETIQNTRLKTVLFLASFITNGLDPVIFSSKFQASYHHL